MHISEFRITGYASFVDSGTVSLKKGFNVFVGKNNSGKSSLLQSLDLAHFRQKPHRSKDIADIESHVHFTLSLSGEELRAIIAAPGNNLIQIPVPADVNSNEEASNFLRDLLAKNEIRVGFVRRNGETKYPYYPSYQAAVNLPKANFFTFRQISEGGALNVEGGPAQGNDDSIGQYVFSESHKYFYAFNAERMRLHKSKFTEKRDLAQDGSNLGGLMAHLALDNRRKYDEFMSHVYTVFSGSIVRIGAIPIGENECEIKVRTSDDGDNSLTDRLAFSLSECGTGIGQVLCILYVAVTAPNSRIILIDEPGSFLHPGAAKKLIEILKRYDHQYVITTHTPEIITAADPATLNLVSWDNSRSTVTPLDRNGVNSARLILADLGLRLSDVFGADEVLWVEGRCCPNSDTRAFKLGQPTVDY